MLTHQWKLKIDVEGIFRCKGENKNIETSDKEIEATKTVEKLVFWHKTKQKLIDFCWIFEHLKCSSCRENRECFVTADKKIGFQGLDADCAAETLHPISLEVDRRWQWFRVSSGSEFDAKNDEIIRKRLGSREEAEFWSCWCRCNFRCNAGFVSVNSLQLWGTAVFHWSGHIWSWFSRRGWGRYLLLLSRYRR